MRWVLWGMFATLLFGLSIPFSKILLDYISPFYLTSLAHFGAALALMAVKVFKPSLDESDGKPPGRASWLWLAGAIVFGGILAPIVGILGIKHSPASVASLLFNLEIVFTTLIAAVFFRETLGGLVWLAVILVFGGGLVTAWEPGPVGERMIGAGLVVLSCLCWALDSNFLRQIKHMGVLRIAVLESMSVGVASLLLGMALRHPIPTIGPLLGAFALGAGAYAVGNAVFIKCLQVVGAARTSAVFGVAPFIGALASTVLLDEPWTWRFVSGLALMAGGVGALLYERVRSDRAAA